jgi:cell wall-associated NlpC family hydrolase
MQGVAMRIETRHVLEIVALSFVGAPYRWGGENPMGGFDCSGLAQEILRAVGMDPPGDQTAQMLYDHFKTRSDTNVRQFGALTFYGTGLSRISHVGFMIDDVHMIEAGGGGSSTIDIDAAIRQNAFVRIRPFNARKDLLDVLNPRYP